MPKNIIIKIKNYKVYKIFTGTNVKCCNKTKPKTKPITNLPQQEPESHCC